ncbi:hypothetical protein SNK03_008051 [Fusarium graminearum]
MFFNCVPVLLNAIINSNSTNTNSNNDASEEGRPFRTCGLAEGVPGVRRARYNFSKVNNAE